MTRDPETLIRHYDLSAGDPAELVLVQMHVARNSRPTCTPSRHP